MYRFDKRLHELLINEYSHTHELLINEYSHTHQSSISTDFSFYCI